MDTLSDLAASGLLGLAFCSAIEKLVPVIPSAGMFLMLGVLGVAHPADLPAVIAITAAGSTAGSLFWYGMGRWLGPTRGDVFVQRMTRRLDIKEEWYPRLKRNYRGNLIRVVFFGQLVPVVRAYMAFPAGVLAMPAPGFVIATFCGALFWNTPFLVSGYLLRSQIFAPDTAAPAAVVAIVLVNLLLFALFRLGRPSRNAA
ncbi:DedA family protein [Rhizobium sp. ZPR3]|uniref:DedA family protein n=2 Tax=unclassified Rhizobium TaxID=2613769 RepID=A0AAU7SLI1_9HYPH